MNAAVSTEAVPAVVPPDDADRRSRFATAIWGRGGRCCLGAGVANAYRGGLVVVWGDPIAYMRWLGVWPPVTGSACPTAASTPSGI